MNEELANVPPALEACDRNADGSSAFDGWRVSIAADQTDSESPGGVDGRSKEECQTVLRCRDLTCWSRAVAMIPAIRQMIRGMLKSLN